MTLDRRALLAGLAGGAVALSCPRRAVPFEPACFAASRKGDRGHFQAALFALAGDEQAIELPGRGHDIALRPGGGEWVAFARRAGRFGVAVSLRSEPPIWFASKPERHFFGHGTFSSDGRLLYATENDYERAAGM